ncbi:MAG: hypothetical protein WCT50_02510 [Patescibacteria group bacterium]
MAKNDFLKNGISELQEMLKNNEVKKTALLKKIEESNKEVYKSKTAIASRLSEELIKLLPGGPCAKLLQLKAYIHAYVGGSNIMSHQEKGTLLQVLINESIKIHPEKNPNMYITTTFIYVDDMHIRNLGIDLFNGEPNSLQKIVEDINIILSRFCKLSVKSDGAPDKPSYQCFTIELK